MVHAPCNNGNNFKWLLSVNFEPNLRAGVGSLLLLSVGVMMTDTVTGTSPAPADDSPPVYHALLSYLIIMQPYKAIWVHSVCVMCFTVNYQ